jgi:hypothetical protein
MGNAGDSNCDKADLYPQCGIFGQCLALGGFRIRELREDVSSRQAGFRHFGHLYPRRRCRFETTEFLAENCCGTCVRRPRNPLNINRVAKYQYFVKVFFARLSFCEVPNDRILVETGLLWAIRDAFPVTPPLSERSYCNFAYSALACFRMGMSGSASFQSVRKS